MKQMWNSILQTVIQFVKDLVTGTTEAMRRNAVLMTAGISVVTALTFVAGDLQVGGHNAMVAFAETPARENGEETELEEADLKESATDKENKEQTKAEPETTEEIIVESESEDETESDIEEIPTTVEDEMDDVRLAAKGKDIEDNQSDAKEIVLSDTDYEILLKIVQAESGCCDEKGQILVANVILNRVESEEFPNTISEVVYQKWQFSPVMDGSINTCKVSQQTRDAVERALEGEDYSDGALYFMNRSRSSSRNVRWFDTHLSYLFKHGEHEFFK